jgi:serine protease Do
MNKKILPLLVLAAGITGVAVAQTKEKSKQDKDQSITIRKKGDSKEKYTIVVDGDNITVNGKPIEDLKDADIEILRNKSMGALMPRMKARIAPMMGSMKMFGDRFPFGGNRAFLGVESEKSDKELLSEKKVPLKKLACEKMISSLKSEMIRLKVAMICLMQLAKAIQKTK